MRLPWGQPSFDISINDFTISLKTEAGKSIKEGFVHISKFMELGKGKWGNEKSDLVGLRERFFKHMKGYQRIFILRCLNQGTPRWHYELVEIPNSLLLKAEGGELEMKHESKQSPKPGYCHVRDGKNLLFQLYFDGGTERKLQIKNLEKRQCTLVAEWYFESSTLTGPISEKQA